MNKYKVKIAHVFSEVLDVEAASEEEARQKAIDILKGENYKGSPHYETTLPLEHWPVVTEEQYNEMVTQFKEELNKEKSNIITP